MSFVLILISNDHVNSMIYYHVSDSQKAVVASGQEGKTSSITGQKIIQVCKEQREQNLWNFAY